MIEPFVTYKDYLAGWMDSTVHEFLHALSEATADTRYALITCLDSNPNPASLLKTSPELKPLRASSSALGTGILVPTSRLLSASSRQQIFFGFDELWFFPEPPLEPKPASGSFVGPARVDKARLNKLGKWLADNGCALGLGGGEGLNFVVPARGMIRTVLGHTLEQHEQAVRASA